jgi:hypothetical protein
MEICVVFSPLILSLLAGVGALPTADLLLPESEHEEVFFADEGTYQVVEARSPLRATLDDHREGEHLILEVVGLGQMKAGQSQFVHLRVGVGEKTKRIEAHLPLEEDRPIDLFVGGFASLPIRYRFSLPAGGGVPLLVEVIGPQESSVVAVRLAYGRSAEKSEGLSLAPISPAPTPPNASPADEPREKLKDVAGWEPSGLVSPTPAPLRETPLPARWRFGGEIALAGALALGGSISQTWPGAGMSLWLGTPLQMLDATLLGLGLDFAQIRAPIPPEADARWDVATTRVRMQVNQRFWRSAGNGRFQLGIVGGAGAVVGTHFVQVGATTRTLPLWGPSLRAGPWGSMDLGPGAVLVFLPLDASWDLAGHSRDFAPVAGSFALGYRLLL